MADFSGLPAFPTDDEMNQLLAQAEADGGLTAADTAPGMNVPAALAGSLNGSSSSSLTQLQQLQSINSSQAAADEGSFVDPETGAAVNPNQVGGGNSLYGAGAATGTATGQAVATLTSDVTAVLNFLKTLSPSNIALGVVVMVVAIILLILGLADVVFGKSAKQTVQIVGSTIKSGVAPE